MKFFLKGITRNIIILWLVSMFTDLSSQIVFPLIPLFLTSLWAWASVVWLVEWAAETMASFLKVVSWFLSDKFKKRKPFIFLWYGISAITKPLFALVKTWPMILFIRVIERIGKWLRDAPRDALIADSTDHRYLWKAYWLQRTLDWLWSVLWAVSALFLFKLFHWNYQKIFLFTALPWIISVFTILFVKEAKKLKASQQEEKKSVLQLWLIQSIKILPNNLLLFIWIRALFTLGNFWYAFLLLKTKVVWLWDTNALFFYILFYGTHALLSTPFGSWSDRIGRKTVLMTWYVLFILTAVLLIFAQSAPIIILWFVLYGVFTALTDWEERAFVVDLCPKEYKATALWLFNTAIWLFALPWWFLIWLLWQHFSPTAAFLFAAWIAIVSLLWLSMIIYKHKK